MGSCGVEVFCKLAGANRNEVLRDLPKAAPLASVVTGV